METSIDSEMERTREFMCGEKFKDLERTTVLSDKGAVDDVTVANMGLDVE